jgi:hypothetical protein
MTKQEIAVLKQSLRAEYEENMAAIERVQRLLERTGLGDDASTTHTDTPKVVISHSVEDTPTLSAAIERLFRDLAPTRQTVGNILEKLRARKFPFETDEPHKSVHSAMWKLEKRGVIRTVIRGRGRKQSIYELASAPTLNGTPTPEMRMRHGAPVPTNLR